MTTQVGFAKFSVALSLSLVLLPNALMARPAGMAAPAPSAAPAFRSPPIPRPAPAPATTTRPVSQTPSGQRPSFSHSSNGLLSRSHGPHELRPFRGARGYGWQPGYAGGVYYDPTGQGFVPNEDP